VQEEVNVKLGEVGITPFRTDIATKLSGGQKRKLSIAMSLIGDNKIVFLDEPSSGIDAYSRRTLWNLFQKYKKNRVVILTTHYMEEADILGDRIAVMSHGRLQCVGTSLFLKSKFGIGYHLDIDASDQIDVKGLTSVVQQHVQGSSILSNKGKELSYVLPLAQKPQFPGLFAALDEEGKGFGATGYGVSLTTLEEVFLALAEEDLQTSSAANLKALGARKSSMEAATDERKGLLADDTVDSSSSVDVNVRVDLTAYDGEQRRVSRWIQWVAMLKKRHHEMMRNRISLFFRYAFPMIYICLMVLVTNVDISQSILQDPVDLSSGSDLAAQYGGAYGITPVGAIDEATVAAEMSFLTAKSSANKGFDFAAFKMPLTRLEFNLRLNTNSSMGALYAEQSPFDAKDIAYLYNLSALHVAPVLVNLVSNQMLQTLDAVANTGAASEVNGIRVTFEPWRYDLNLPFDVFGLIAAIMLGIGFGAVTIGYALDIIVERENGSFHLQRVMGVDRITYWLGMWSHSVFSLVQIIFIAFLIMWAFDKTFMLGANLVVAAVVFLVFAVNSVVFCSYLSFWFESSKTAKSVLILVFNVMAIILFITCLTIFGEDTDESQLLAFACSNFPVFGLMWGLYELAALDVLRTQCARLPACVAPSFDEGFKWEYTGAPLLGMLLSTILFLLLLARLESKSVSSPGDVTGIVEAPDSEEARLARTRKDRCVFDCTAVCIV
jgi:ABC-type multidrug transport system ATPase subunit